MRRTIGVLAADHIAVGLLESNRVSGPMRRFPEHEEDRDILQAMPADGVAGIIAQMISELVEGGQVAAIGVGFPGIIRNGVVDDSPNLRQMKGFNLLAALTMALAEKEISAPVLICNDADAMAAGIAATYGQLDRFIRVWTLGNGIGFGRYPWAEGVWEGGHMVVTLDPKEHYCGCGGVGHLEGIMGHRAMRLRFLDMEPEEVFASARSGDERCDTFAKLWHRALAAATATSVHLDGPGKFFITGPNAKFLDLGLLHQYLHEMVKMSPLQGYVFQVVPASDEMGIIGAAVNAEQSALPQA